VPTSGGGAGGGGSTGATLDYLTRYIGDRGVLTSDTSVRTYDAKAIIFIPKGTEFKVNLDQIGAYITTRAIRTEVPPPPKGGDIIGLAYEFGPEGAAFDPAITLKMIYDPALIPSGINEGDLKIGYWDGSQWQVLDSTVDPPNRTITAQISHFNVYAVISVPPATFTLLSINISPDRLNPGDPVTIQAVISNIGGSPGIYTAVLKVNGIQEGSKSVRLDAGKSATVMFQLQKDAPGDYLVSINGETGRFNIIAPPPVTVEPTPEVQPEIAAEPVYTSPPTIIVTPMETSTPTHVGFAVNSSFLWAALGILLVAGLIGGLIVFRIRTNNKKP
jgi:hypothetical protein